MESKGARIVVVLLHVDISTLVCRIMMKKNSKIKRTVSHAAQMTTFEYKSMAEALSPPKETLKSGVN